MMLTPEELEQMTGRKQPAERPRRRSEYVARRLAELGGPRGRGRNPAPINVGKQTDPIDLDAWRGPSLEPLATIDPKVLPLVTNAARRPGVYFLFLADELIYIGVANNVRARVQGHWCYRPHPYDVARYLPIEWPWHLALEAYFIDRFKPPRNVIAKGKR